MSLWSAFKAQSRLNFRERWSYGMSRMTSYLGVLLAFTVFLFLGKLVDPKQLPELGGGGYLEFAVVGMTISNVIARTSSGAAGALREALLAGTLEARLSAPLPDWQLVGLSAASVTLMAIPAVAVELLIALILGVQFEVAAGPLLMLLALLAFAALPFGLVASAAVIVIKRGDPVTYIVSAVTALLSGVYFPRSLLPESLRWLGDLLPATHAVQLARAALLGAAPAGETAGAALRLLLSGAAMWPIAIAALAFALKFGKLRGNLNHY